MAKDIKKKDLYLILGVDETATEKDLLKGYRKKALKCHPDKNPDNPKAAEQFHELSQALEILSDPAARAAYDKSRKAKKAVEARNKVLDSKRKKFKDDLEARELAAEQRLQKVSELDTEKKLQAEIERLRTEGSRLLEQEKIRLQDLIKATATSKLPTANMESDGMDAPRIKLKWKSTKSDSSNGGYNQKILSDIFSCYGKINTLLVSSKRNGSAIVEFEASGVSSDVLGESGLAENPLSIVWLCGKPSESFSHDDGPTPETNLSPCNLDKNEKSSVHFDASSDTVPSTATFSCGVFQPGSNASTDFESLVLRKMRQAEERKKLIEQMAKEDEENG